MSILIHLQYSPPSATGTHQSYPPTHPCPGIPLVGTGSSGTSGIGEGRSSWTSVHPAAGELSPKHTLTRVCLSQLMKDFLQLGPEFLQCRHPGMKL